MTGTRAALAGLWDEAWFWRSLAAGLGVLALALLVAALIGRAAPDFAARPIVAVLRDAAGHPLWAIRLACGAGQIAADSLSPPPVPAGHAYQLWLEAPGVGGPRPLGLLAADRAQEDRRDAGQHPPAGCSGRAHRHPRAPRRLAWNGAERARAVPRRSRRTGLNPRRRNVRRLSLFLTDGHMKHVSGVNRTSAAVALSSSISGRPARRRAL